MAWQERAGKAMVRDMAVNPKTTKEELIALSQKNEPESLTLEFKSGNALNDHKKKGREREKCPECKIAPPFNCPVEEISKDISAMANAAGGRIIYGIGERDQDGNRFAGAIEVVDASKFTDARLHEIAKNHIHPPIPDLEVEAVNMRPVHEGWCYVVHVPKATKARQAKDQRFYTRMGVAAQRMWSHQIDDVNGRQTHAKVKIEAKIGFNPNDIPNGPNGVALHLNLKITNQGDGLAEFWVADVYMPIQTPWGQMITESMPLGQKRRGYWQFSVGGGQPMFPRRTIATNFTMRWTRSSPSKAQLPLMFAVFASNSPDIWCQVDLAEAAKTWATAMPIEPPSHDED
jgi:hypothetical protein